MEEMYKLYLDVRMHRRPNEIAEPMPSDQDVRARPYDADYAGRFWRILQQSDRVLKIFRAGFVGKCSPVHFFWGAADLAVTRFSGRKAPQHPGGVPNLPEWVTQEAYSHEVSSCGFWPGSGPIPYAAFYSYPEPARFSKAPVKPTAIILPYDGVRESESPDEILLEFLQTTYEAAANLAQWNRAALERSEYPKSGRSAQSGAALIR